MVHFTAKKRCILLEVYVELGFVCDKNCLLFETTSISSFPENELLVSKGGGMLLVPCQSRLLWRFAGCACCVCTYVRTSG